MTRQAKANEASLITPKVPIGIAHFLPTFHGGAIILPKTRVEKLGFKASGWAIPAAVLGKMAAI